MSIKIFEFLFVSAVGLAALTTGCSTSSSGTSGETHFLSCNTTADCASLTGDFACVDKVCKESSDGSAGMGGAPGSGGASGQGAKSGSGGTSERPPGGSGGGGAAPSAFCAAVNASSGDLDGATLSSLLGDAANSCVLQASDYDQTCKKDADCVAVGLGNACETPCEVLCETGAINAGAMAKYQADLARNPISACPGLLCGCPCIGFPRCRGGLCQLSSCAIERDAGDAGTP